MNIDRRTQDPEPRSDSVDADVELIEVVRARGLGSPEFRYLSATLFESAMGALGRIGSRRIIPEMRKRGLDVPAPVPSGFADEFPVLVFLSVKGALEGFMTRQVMEGGWSPHGGASLRTFFTNSVIYAFVDHYRRYHREETSREIPTDEAGGPDDADAAESVVWTRRDLDPELAAVHRDLIRHALSGEDSLIRYILLRISEGYTQKEIASELGKTEAAVNSQLRRFRDRRARRGGAGTHDE